MDKREIELIAGEFDTDEPLRMISTQGLAESEIYTKVRGRERDWYYNNADLVYCTGLACDGGRGMAGATLTFHLEDGTEDRVKAPWISNTSALYADTGVDLRDQHLTFGVVGLEREGSILRRLIYKEDEWEVGTFDRVDQIAQSFADSLGCRVYYYKKSMGGSSFGPQEPSK